MNKEEQLHLNARLHDECCKQHISFKRIEQCLIDGADPNGFYDDNWHVFEDIICFCKYEKKRIIKITELFIKYGMDFSEWEKKDEFNEIENNPLWDMAFYPNELSTQVLAKVLEAGAGHDCILDLVDHIFEELDYDWFEGLDCDESRCIWCLRMLMLCAAYDKVLSNGEWFYKWVRQGIPKYPDLSIFKDYMAIDYEIKHQWYVDTEKNISGVPIVVHYNGEVVGTLYFRLHLVDAPKTL